MEAAGLEDSEAQLQLKKRARRRLVGAVAFVSVVAIGLPLVMDQEPREALQDVEIRIPGQDEKTFAPRLTREPVERPTAPPTAPSIARPVETPTPAVKPDAQPNARVVETTRGQDETKPTAKAPEKPAAKAAEKPVEKSPEKPAAKTPEKAAEKTPEKAPEKSDEARRAAAILAGQSDNKPAAASGEYLVLIGAFADEANVKNLKTKLGELGLKVISEPLDTPQGRKTRVRAGPFASREAAEKALVKMQKIGVSGVVAPRQ